MRRAPFLLPGTVPRRDSIDWSNPITKGLVFCLSPDGRDMISRVMGTLSASAEIGSCHAGKGLFAPSVYSGENYLSWNTPPVTGVPLTFAVCHFPTGNGLTNPIISLSNSTVLGNRDAFSLSKGATATDVRTYRGRVQDGTVQVQTGDMKGVCDGYGGAVVVYPSITSMTLFVEGKKGTTVTTSCAPSGIDNIVVGGRAATNAIAGPLGVYLVAAVFNRALSDAEAISLSINPYQLFTQSAKRPLFRFVLPQLLSPTGTIAGGTWLASNGGTTYSCVDESVADGSDYAYTLTSGAWEEFTFPDGGSVSASGGFVRYNIPAGSGAITVELRQGASVLETWGPHALTGSLQTFSQSITASTSDSNDLRVRFTAS